MRKKLPVGVDLFDNMIGQDFYYLDKTGFIKELLNNRGEVNLFTRPRRFGKTLTMSMLKEFFEIGSDPSLFHGLLISREAELCERYQGKFPVIFLSLKGVEGAGFEEAMEMFAILAARECMRLSYLLESTKVEEADKEKLKRLEREQGSLTELKSSLVTLMRMLHAHYGKKVILLIDECDVPLDKAKERGYYGKMIDFLRGFFGEAFKTNPDLYFAVVTGCLRISKESIFTGVNNLKADTISDVRYDEYFGFTDQDVKMLLKDYGVPDAYDEMKEWYDGYHFGNMDVYCPWDVVNHVDRLQEKPGAKPKAYWNNTSSNQMVRQFIDLADASTREEIERLISGESIRTVLEENLTYGELTEDKEHLWSVLYLTGYLTLDRNAPDTDDGMASLVIPNKEVREIFVEKIKKWFSEELAPASRPVFCEKLWEQDAEDFQEALREVLMETISYYDYHENYYHALLTGLLMNDAYIVRSNYEMGKGRSDIVVEDNKKRRAAIIETKYSRDYDDLEKDSKKALEQIREKQYAYPYQKRKYQVIAYGIAFSGKDCFVLTESL